MTDRYGPMPAGDRAPGASFFSLTSGSLMQAVVFVLALWILHNFLEAMLAACITAVASWPLYARFANRLPVRLRSGVAPLVFSFLMLVFVLAPIVFAFGALLSEAHALIQEIAAADQRGIALPPWFENVPVLGPWIVARWQSTLAHPGTLMQWAQQTDPAVLLGWLQSLGHFTAHHAIIILFTILLLFFLYQQGEVLAAGCRSVLRRRLGAGVEHYIDLGTRALRASVNSILIVGLFDGLAAAVAFTLIDVPQALLWAAITGVLALVPFLGYLAVAGMALHLMILGGAATALLALALGWAILLAGDKVVRPAVARGGVGLPFVWVLMGCLGGFEVLGLVGLVIGPVLLTLAKELWEQRVQDGAASAEALGAAPAEQRPRDARQVTRASPSNARHEDR